MPDFRWLSGVVLAGTVLAGSGSQAGAADISCTAQPSPSAQQVLREVVSGQPVPAGFSVTYTDIDSLHGGLSLSIHADGMVEQQAVREKAGQPGEVTPWEWRKLAALIVLKKLWQQRTPERAPGNDESRARLILRCGDQVSEVWEWVSDLEKNGRLIQVREAMKKSAWTP